MFDRAAADRHSDAMTVSLPSSFEDFVHRKVAAGEFASAADVVCEGLRLLQRQEDWKADVRQKIDIGLEEAQKGELHTPEEARTNLTSRKQAWRREHGAE